MTPQNFKLLTRLSNEPLDVNRLIVSAFLKFNNIHNIKNEIIRNLNIQPSEPEAYSQVLKLISVFSKKKLNFDIELLVELFEFVISPQDKVVNGAVYTPCDIREFIVKSSIIRHRNTAVRNNFRIADIACGCGGFLLDCARYIKKTSGRKYQDIFASNLFGLDLQEYSINRTRILLSLLAITESEDEEEFSFNLFVGNSLEFDWAKSVSNFNGFDCIVGNPPYVRYRNLDIKTRNLLNNWEVCRSGLTDLYIPFFEIGLHSLKKNGVLGYITMNSFFKSLNGRKLRKYFHKNKYSFEIYDFGSEQIFKSRSTYTCICLIQNKPDIGVRYTKVTRNTLKSFTNSLIIRYSELNPEAGWNLRNIDHIDSFERCGRPFRELYKMRHGLATLKNNVYIFKPYREDHEFYYFLKNDNSFRVEKLICRDVVNPNRLKAENDLKSFSEKIIFPYSNDHIPKLINEEHFSETFPQAYNYLLGNREVLASRDKGKGRYENWYAYGRSQSLEKTTSKLFFPKISNRPLRCFISPDGSLLHYNGLAIISDYQSELYIIKGILESRLFWYYITSTSKPYNSSYYSLNGNYIKNFGIPDFTADEKQFFLQSDKVGIEKLLESKYGILVNDTKM